MMPVTDILNIAAYKFVDLTDREDLRAAFVAQAEAFQIRGTILLAPEGINMFLAGAEAQLRGFIAWLREDARFADIYCK